MRYTAVSLLTPRQYCSDCNFLSRMSKWGKAGDIPTGVLRLLLNFHQPAGYKLSSAETHLCFLPSDEGLLPTITGLPYPRTLWGPPFPQQRSRRINIQPRVEVTGTSAEIGSLHNSAEWTNTLRWLLIGSSLPDDQDLYTKAEW